jgi:hypothetical protein
VIESWRAPDEGSGFSPICSPHRPNDYRRENNDGKHLPFGAKSPQNDLIPRLGIGLDCRHFRRRCIQLLSFLGSLSGCSFVICISTVNRTNTFHVVKSIRKKPAQDALSTTARSAHGSIIGLDCRTTEITPNGRQDWLPVHQLPSQR